MTIMDAVAMQYMLVTTGGASVMAIVCMLTVHARSILDTFYYGTALLTVLQASTFTKSWTS